MKRLSAAVKRKEIKSIPFSRFSKRVERKKKFKCVVMFPFNRSLISTNRCPNLMDKRNWSKNGFVLHLTACLRLWPAASRNFIVTQLSDFFKPLFLLCPNRSYGNLPTNQFVRPATTTTIMNRQTSKNVIRPYMNNIINELMENYTSSELFNSGDYNDIDLPDKSVKFCMYISILTVCVCVCVCVNV